MGIAVALEQAAQQAESDSSVNLGLTNFFWFSAISAAHERLAFVRFMFLSQMPARVDSRAIALGQIVRTVSRGHGKSNPLGSFGDGHAEPDPPQAYDAGRATRGNLRDYCARAGSAQDTPVKASIWRPRRKLPSLPARPERSWNSNFAKERHDHDRLHPVPAGRAENYADARPQEAVARTLRHGGATLQSAFPGKSAMASLRSTAGSRQASQAIREGDRRARRTASPR